MLPDDTNLLCQRALAGDQSAFAALYDQHATGLYRLCYGVLLHPQDAEDVVQEAFVYAFRNLQRYDPARAAFKTWLYTIAVSRCRNVYRRRRPFSLDFSALMRLPLPGPTDETPEGALAHQHAREALGRALQRLSPRLREAVVLRYGHGLTFREMADVLDCPPKTAESRVRMAHNQLRGLLGGVGRGVLDELLSVGH